MARRKKDNPAPARQEMVHSPPPVRLDRPPRTELRAGVEQLDRDTFHAVDAVAERLRAAMEPATSLARLHLLGTRRQMLLAMKGTHRSLRHLVAQSRQDMDLALDALPIARVQLERCFLALLLADNPDRWHGRYRKNAWKAFAEKFFRDQAALGHLEPFAGYFGPSGTGIRFIRDFAREMDINEDEIQTLRAQVLDEPIDPRWKPWFIPDMPTPGRCLQELEGPAHKLLARLLYPHYDNLSHFSHGGLVGVMEAAIPRGELPDPGPGAGPRAQSWRDVVLEQALPVSYVALLLVATVFALPLEADDAVRADLVAAWQPYHSDGSPLGVALWDAWAAAALRAQPDGTNPA